jgi:DNA mismatch repair ATPase MutS
LRAIASVHICQVLKDGIHFTTLGSAGLKALGERILEIDSEYDSQSRAVVTQAIDIARSYAPVLEASSSLVSELDAFCSLAHMAVSAPGKYVRPDVRAAGS